MQAEPDVYTILAAVSFDSTGSLALCEATRTAVQRRSPELHVVYVLPTHGSPYSSRAAAALHGKLADARTALRTRIERTTVPRTLRVQGHVRAGAPVTGILQVAAEIDADLIVVGGDEHTRLRQLILGSVAESVVRQAHCPVLVAIRNAQSDAERPAAIDPRCRACLQIRAATMNATLWCERHSRARLRPHLYEPSRPRRPPAWT